MRVLAIDIGSSSARSALFNERGKSLAGTAASRAYAVDYTADGAAVLNPKKLFRAVRACVRESTRAAGTIDAIAASAFWHGLLGLNRARDPITPIYMWGDGRAADDARKLREEVDERAVHARTGCMLRAPFWPAKLAWLRRTEPALFRRTKFWVSPADWILAELFDAKGTSASMASATGLFNLETNTWDQELCTLTAEADSLPAITSRNGHTFNAIGDGAAGNLGSGADHRGAFAINVGTSAAVRAVCGRSSASVPFGLFRYVLDEEREVIGGAISNAGNLRRWCLRQLRIPEQKSSRFTRGDREATARSDLVVLPFWVAERAPTWPEKIRGTVTGLTQATAALDIERAAQCSVFYRLAQILELAETTTGRARELIVSGGILRAPALVRLLADAIGRDVILATQPEASLEGAAIYALKKLGCAPGLRQGRVVKHDRNLAGLHRERRARQESLERLFSSAA